MPFLLFLSLLLNLGFHSLPASNYFQEALINVQATYQFGESLSISASIPQAASIESVSVTLQSSNGQQLQFSTILDTDGNISVQIDLRENQISAFSRVYYWFEITDKDGTTLTSPSYWFDYQDNRFIWQKSESKWFIINSTDSLKISATDLQNIALASLKSATDILPISPPLPIQIYIYPDAESLMSTLISSSSKEWIAGEALPNTGMIFVSASGDINNQNELERQIPHELMHLLEYEVARQNYDAAPVWLLEGLATNAENYPSPEQSRLLQNAYQTNNLIPMRQLCSSFPPDASQTSLAYAQSASFVSYLSGQYGTSKIIELLELSGDGLNCSQILAQGLGKDLTSTEADWLRTTFNANSNGLNLMDYWPVFPGLLIISGIILVVRRHQKIEKTDAKHNGK